LAEQLAANCGVFTSRRMYNASPLGLMTGNCFTAAAAAAAAAAPHHATFEALLKSW